MQSIQLDAPLVTELERATDEVALCDAAGRKLGYFVPASMHDAVYAWANSLLDRPHELDPPRGATGGKTTREAIAYLEEVARQHRRGQP